MTKEQHTPEIYLSMPHPCSYLPGRTATTLFVDPRHILNEDDFGRFMASGFRRSGDLVYRPHCQDCQACVPVRVPVREFRPTRSQRRNLRHNESITVFERPAVFNREHFELYRRYQASRHRGEGMDDPDPGKYMNFLIGRAIDTRFYEFRDGYHLLAVAVVDHLPDGLSAVYTFYDPMETARGLGVYAVLWEIEQTRQLNLPYLYLGYWIRESRKMAYKTDFRPIETHVGGRWQRLIG